MLIFTTTNPANNFMKGSLLNQFSNEDNDLKNCYTLPYPWEITPIQPIMPTPNWTYEIKTIVVAPEIKTLEVKDKLLFYYWSEGILFYAIYKKGEKLSFESTNDFLEVLKKLGLFE